jgi:hypothetical protein
MTKKDWSKRQDRRDREGKAKMVPESPDCDSLQSGLFEFHAFNSNSGRLGGIDF